MNHFHELVNAAEVAKRLGSVIHQCPQQETLGNAAQASLLAAHRAGIPYDDAENRITNLIEAVQNLRIFSGSASARHEMEVAYITARQAIQRMADVVENIGNTREKPVDLPDMPQLASGTALAEKLKANPKAVESFLRRRRQKFPDCYVENDSPRRNEPKYLYRTADVWPDLKKHFGE